MVYHSSLRGSLFKAASAWSIKTDFIVRWDYFFSGKQQDFLTCLDSCQYGNMPSNPELGLASMYRVIKKSGADRVSDDAADELRKVLEDVAEKIAKQAVELSVHAGRKTVKSEDVHLASKNILKL